MIAVKDLMTAIGSEAAPDDLLASVVAIMRRNNHSCVVVTRDQQVVGLVTERSLVDMLLHADYEASINQPVSSVMARNPLCVNCNASLLEALKLARAHKVRHLPVVDDEQRLIGMVTHTDLINVYVDVLENQVQLMDDNMHLRAQSREDPLLGIGNRRAMESDLRKVTAHARHSRRTFAVALFDLDHFKLFNDHYGHIDGDLALKQVVNTMVKNLRQGDSLYRYGGEELLLLMPNTDTPGAMQAAERIREAVGLLALQHRHSPYGVLTISGGLASEYSLAAEELIAAADHALYLAKSMGRNRIACYQPD